MQKKPLKFIATPQFGYSSFRHVALYILSNKNKFTLIFPCFNVCHSNKHAPPAQVNLDLSGHFSLVWFGFAQATGRASNSIRRFHRRSFRRYGSGLLYRSSGRLINLSTVRDLYLAFSLSGFDCRYRYVDGREFSDGN